MAEEYKPKKNIGKKHVNRIIIIIVLILLLACGGIYVFVQYKLNQIQKTAKGDSERISVEKEDFDTDENIDTSKYPETSSDDIEWPDDVDIMKNKDISNILLIGQDSRSTDKNARSRSDSMMILTINKKDKILSLTSLCRDLYVQIPGYSDNRMNAAYAFGGADLLDETIEKNFGVSIDANIVINFDAFMKVIDRLGGIDLDLTEKETQVMNRYIEELNRIAGTNANMDMMSESDAGSFHANGKQALAYSRIRYVPTAINGTPDDFGRTERQRIILSRLFDMLKEESWYTLMGLTDEIFPMITTDLTNGEILSYGYTIFKLGANKVESYRIPEDTDYSNATIRRMMVLVPDLAVCRDKMQEYIYGK